MRQLSGQDAMFLYLESAGASMHLGALYLYDPRSAPGGRIRTEDILDHLRGRMHVSRVFRQRLVSVPLNLDHPYWVDATDFEFDLHIRFRTCPAPGDWAALRGLIGELHSEPIDMHRPPWEMVLIDGIDKVEGLPPNAFAIFARYHHAAIDGVSGTNILLGLHDKSPVPQRAREGEDWSAGERPSIVELLNRAAVSNLRSPLRMARAAASTLPQIRRSLLRPDEDAPQRSAVPVTRFNKEISAARIFDARDFKLETLKRIARTVPGATLNDALLTLCGGAVVRYLDYHGEAPGESLWAMVPMNIRQDAGDDTAGNAVAPAFLPICSDIEDPIARLRAVRAVTAEAKNPKDSLHAKKVAEIASSLPAQTLAVTGKLATTLGLSRITHKLFNLVITNIPGPRETLYLAGAELKRMSGCGPIGDGMGLFIAAGSYRDVITLSVTACPELLPDSDFFMDCLGAAAAELAERAGMLD